MMKVLLLVGTQTFMILVSIIVCVNEEQKMKAICLGWEESEAGWGTAHVQTIEKTADNEVIITLK